MKPMNVDVSITEFALLERALADPFVCRRSVLDAAGLTESHYSKVRKKWIHELTQNERSQELVRQFRAAYRGDLDAIPDNDEVSANGNVRTSVSIGSAEALPANSCAMPSYLLLNTKPQDGSGQQVAFEPAPIIAALDNESGEPSSPMPVAALLPIAAEHMEATLCPTLQRYTSAVLPFGDTPSPSFLASISSPHTIAPRDDAGETMFLAVAPNGSCALPFTKDPDPPLPPLSLEQYASLLVDLARSPARRVAIMAQYGIMDEAMMRRLQLLWKTRGELDFSQRERIEVAKVEYARWLTGKG